MPGGERRGAGSRSAADRRRPSCPAHRSRAGRPCGRRSSLARRESRWSPGALTPPCATSEAACTPWSQTARASVPAKARTRKARSRRIRRLTCLRLTVRAGRAPRTWSGPTARGCNRASPGRASGSSARPRRSRAEPPARRSARAGPRARGRGDRAHVEAQHGDVHRDDPREQGAEDTIQTIPPVTRRSLTAGRGRGGAPGRVPGLPLPRCAPRWTRRPWLCLHRRAQARRGGAGVCCDLVGGRTHRTPLERTQDGARSSSPSYGSSCFSGRSSTSLIETRSGAVTA